MSFGYNSGYIRNSRSVRSASAIEDFRIPLSHFKKSIITDFLNHKIKEIAMYDDDVFTIENIDTLRKVSLNVWKIAAKEAGTSEWHHTSSYFNKTYHYNLEDVALYIIENLESLKNLKESTAEKNTLDFNYGVINVQEWGGSRRHPKLLGNKTIAGIIIGDWLHSLEGNKYKITANKVNWIDKFNSYVDLTKKHGEFKNTKKQFNDKIKEKIND